MAKKVSRRMRELLAKVDEKAYEPLDALKLLKETATAKFKESAEVHIRLGIDPKYTDQQIRTTVALPKGTGQDIRVAVVARGEKVAEAIVLWWPLNTWIWLPAKPKRMDFYVHLFHSEVILDSTS